MMQDEVNKIVSMRWPTDGKFGFRESARSFPISECWRASARQLERPSRRIAFLLSEQRGVSVIDLIARAGACDVAAAEDIYSRWLDKAGGGRNLHSGSRGAQSPLLSARFAARCRSQSSRTRSAAAETPIFPLPLYLGIALFCTALSVTESGSTESGCGCRSWAILKSRRSFPVAEVVSSVRKNRERNSRSRRR